MTNESHTVGRPHKILDAAILEQFCNRFYLSVLNEWEYSDAAEYVDFWDWLEMGEHYYILDEFEDWFRQEHIEHRHITK